MLDIKNIISSWYFYVQGSSETKALMEKRIAICMQCEHKKEIIDIHQCGLCHCPLNGKTSNPNNACPDGRWGIQAEESYF